MSGRRSRVVLALGVSLGFAGCASVPPEQAVSALEVAARGVPAATKAWRERGEPSFLWGAWWADSVVAPLAALDDASHVQELRFGDVTDRDYFSWRGWEWTHKFDYLGWLEEGRLTGDLQQLPGGVVARPLDEHGDWVLGLDTPDGTLTLFWTEQPAGQLALDQPSVERLVAVCRPDAVLAQCLATAPDVDAIRESTEGLLELEVTQRHGIDVHHEARARWHTFYPGRTTASPSVPADCGSPNAAAAAGWRDAYGWRARPFRVGRWTGAIRDGGPQAQPRYLVELHGSELHDGRHVEVLGTWLVDLRSADG